MACEHDASGDVRTLVGLRRTAGLADKLSRRPHEQAMSDTGDAPWLRKGSDHVRVLAPVRGPPSA